MSRVMPNASHNATGEGALVLDSSPGLSNVADDADFVVSLSGKGPETSIG